MTIWEWLEEDDSRQIEITSTEVILRHGSGEDDEGHHISATYRRPEEIPRLLFELVVEMKEWEVDGWKYELESSLEAIFGKEGA